MSRSTQLRMLFVIAFLTVVALQATAPRSLLAYLQPDPACEQQCHDDYIFCLDYRCDPRGTCTCWTDYQYCVSYCPQICVEPRNVRDYTVRVRINVQLTSITTCLSSVNGPRIHGRINYRERLDTYRETTACNGTKTTQLLQSVTLNPTFCWAPVNPAQFCGNPQDGNGFYPKCTF